VLFESSPHAHLPYLLQDRFLSYPPIQDYVPKLSIPFRFHTKFFISYLPFMCHPSACCLIFIELIIIIILVKNENYEAHRCVIFCILLVFLPSKDQIFSREPHALTPSYSPYPRIFRCQQCGCVTVVLCV
jgi:hypothetical protein